MMGGGAFAPPTAGVFASVEVAGLLAVGVLAVGVLAAGFGVAGAVDVDALPGCLDAAGELAVGTLSAGFGAAGVTAEDALAPGFGAAGVLGAELLADDLEVAGVLDAPALVFPEPVAPDTAGCAERYLSLSHDCTSSTPPTSARTRTAILKNLTMALSPPE